ncbi:hypothetical protein HDU97_009430 [Phlyctochytrium planicorne]|nr:hypothetical protein HDU97_009430 [Phlyctochytrium planicorne]
MLFSTAIIVSVAALASSVHSSAAPQVTAPPAPQGFDGLTEILTGGPVAQMIHNKLPVAVGHSVSKGTTFTYVTVQDVNCPTEIGQCVLDAFAIGKNLSPECIASATSAAAARTTSSAPYSDNPNIPTCVCPYAVALANCTQQKCYEAYKRIVSTATKCFPGGLAKPSSCGASFGSSWVAAVAASGAAAAALL